MGKSQLKESFEQFKEIYGRSKELILEVSTDLDRGIIPNHNLISAIQSQMELLKLKQIEIESNLDTGNVSQLDESKIPFDFYREQIANLLKYEFDEILTNIITTLKDFVSIISDKKDFVDALESHKESAKQLLESLDKKYTENDIFELQNSICKFDDFVNTLRNELTVEKSMDEAQRNEMLDSILPNHQYSFKIIRGLIEKQYYFSIEEGSMDSKVETAKENTPRIDDDPSPTKVISTPPIRTFVQKNFTTDFAQISSAYPIYNLLMFYGFLTSNQMYQLIVRFPNNKNFKLNQLDESIQKLVSKSYINTLESPIHKQIIFYLSDYALMALDKEKIVTLMKRHDNSLFDVTKKYIRASNILNLADEFISRNNVTVNFTKWIIDHYTKYSSRIIINTIANDIACVYILNQKSNGEPLKTIVSNVDNVSSDMITSIAQNSNLELLIVCEGDFATEASQIEKKFGEIIKKVYAISLLDDQSQFKSHESGSWTNFIYDPTHNNKQIFDEVHQNTTDTEQDKIGNREFSIVTEIKKEPEIEAGFPIEESGYKDDTPVFTEGNNQNSEKKVEKSTNEVINYEESAKVSGLSLEDSKNKNTTDVVKTHKESVDTQTPITPTQFFENSDMNTRIQQVLDDKSIIDDEIRMTSIIFDIIASGYVVESIGLLKSLILANSENKQSLYYIIYKHLTMATHVGFNDIIYTSESLREIFSYSNYSSILPERYALTSILSHLWGMIYPSTEGDIYIFDVLQPMDARFEDLKKTIDIKVIKAFKDLIHEANKLKEHYIVGLSQADISKHSRFNKHDLSAKKIKEDAISYSKNGAFKSIPVNVAFGPGSKLNKAINSICINEKTALVDVNDFLIDFFGIDNQEYLEQDFNDHKIMEYAKKTWDSKKRQNQFDSDRLKGFYKPIAQRIHLIRKWHFVQLNESSKSEETIRLQGLIDVNNNILISVDNLLSVISQNHHTTTSDESSINILEFSIKQLKYKIGLINNDSNNIFTNFLQTPFVNLNNDLLPICDIRTETYEGYELWRRILLHLITEKKELSSVLLFIDNAEHTEWYGNYGTYKKILKILHKYEIIDNEESIEKLVNISVKSIESAHKSMLDEIELELSFGRLGEEHAEEMIYNLNQTIESFKNQSDQARYYAYLEIFRSQINKYKCEIRANLNYRLDELLKINSSKKPQIESFVSKYTDAENYAFVDDFIKIIMADPSLLEIETFTDFDFFRSYLQKEKDISSVYKDNRLATKDVSQWQISELNSVFPENYRFPEQENAQKLLQNWPHGTTKFLEQTSGSLKIKELLTRIGFKNPEISKVEFVDLNTKESNKIYSYEVFKVIFSEFKNNRKRYVHPISIFGSQLDSNDFYILWEHSRGKSSTELFNDIKDFWVKFKKDVIVLYDGFLTFKEKSKITQSFSSYAEKSSNQFFIIDHSLLIFLASYKEEDRFDVFMKCTLPYSFFQPYEGRGTGSIPQDMFFGRQKELDLILSPNCPHILYGGRQLGKSALLQKARSVATSKRDKTYAVYVELPTHKQVNKQSTAAKALESKLRDELLSIKQLGFTKTKLKTFKDMIFEIQTRFESRDVSEFYLFIDEADSLLEDPSQDKSNIVHQLNQLAKGTGNKFKFIFSGLHNVAALKRLYHSNAEISHLGEPLCIKPLKQVDAFKLIKKPFTYLGIEISDNHVGHIAASANYYPGIIHLICFHLVESIKDQFKTGDYSYEKGNPPYAIKEINFSRISNQKIADEVKKKIKLTITVDEKYEMMANIFAYLYHELKSKSTEIYGFTLQQIKDEIKSLKPKYVSNLAADEIQGLLTEMTEMGILYYNNVDNRYTLRKNSFRDMIGSSEETLNFIINGNEENHD